MCLKEEDLGSRVGSSDSETLPDIVTGIVCPSFSDDVSVLGLTAFLAGERLLPMTAMAMLSRLTLS